MQLKNNKCQHTFKGNNLLRRLRLLYDWRTQVEFYWVFKVRTYVYVIIWFVQCVRCDVWVPNLYDVCYVAWMIWNFSIWTVTDSFWVRIWAYLSLHTYSIMMMIKWLASQVIRTFKEQLAGREEVLTHWYIPAKVTSDVRKASLKV